MEMIDLKNKCLCLLAFGFVCLKNKWFDYVLLVSFVFRIEMIDLKNKCLCFRAFGGVFACGYNMKTLK